METEPKTPEQRKDFKKIMDHVYDPKIMFNISQEYGFQVWALTDILSWVHKTFKQTFWHSVVKKTSFTQKVVIH